jgi:multidrug efflux pump subunit AcrB
MGYSALQLQADVASGSSSGQAMKDVEQLVTNKKILV